ncbi:phage antirepressor KilAC domain-containing protein [Agarivorans sp. B2Z047]|uniref:phage antirepressor KilAC domain-containing protein n=1 Tax=Agarivorans sp. B2Z047 TaxID=2652721 RepID=UPI001D155252|nr:phage antirepressor KilAC domain-containing protein [Agarivorans sp. B2Z047]UQN41855.1 phage antirepressor KilAC domain-containing protein [Agarivorans sp. B2Z047]
MANLTHNLSMHSLDISQLVESRHDKVKQSIERLSDRATIELPPMGEIKTTTKPTKVYLFNGEQGKRDSYVVVAQLSPEFTARLVDRWQELEQKQTSPAELSRMEILTLAMQAEQENQQLKYKIEEDAPKVAFAEQVEVAPDAISVAQAAKILGTGQRRLFSKLRELKWVTRRNEPYQDKIEAGLLDVKLGSWQHPDHGLKQSVTALITGKGLSKLQLLLSIPASSPLFSSAQMSAHQMGEK